MLILVECNETVKTEGKTFEFPDEIQKVIVMGQGANREIKRRTIEHADDIDRIKTMYGITKINSGCFP